MSNRARLHRLSRIACGISVGLGTVLLVLSSSPDRVQADVTGSGMSCTGTINGVSVAGRSAIDPAAAIDVPEHTQVTVHMEASAPIFRRLIQVDFLGLSKADIVGNLMGGTVHAGYIADDSTNVSGTSWDKTIDVDSYARYGVGMYSVDATSSGPKGSCVMSALVRIAGNPLSSVAGEAGAAAGVIGLLGLGVAGAKAAGESGGDGAGGADDSGGDNDGGGSDDDEPAPLYVAEELGFCAFWVIPALLLTIRAMVAGDPPPPPEPSDATSGPPPPAAAPVGAYPPPPVTAPAAAVARAVRPLPRVRWRLRLSFVAILSGFIGSLGVVVFLQQAGLIFPTGTFLLIALLIGILLGIVVPSLFRLVAVRRINRRVAARSARTRQRTAPPA